MEKNKIYLGNSLNVLQTFPDESIDLCVTSPPYYNLRNYGGDLEIWGGDDKCEHEWGESEPFRGHKHSHGKGSNVMEVHKVAKESDETNWDSGSFCQKCGAWRGELGLEPNPDLYIKHLTDIFREVKRVLKSTGTLWVNIGDSYAGSGKAGNPDNTYYENHTQFNKNEIDDRKGIPNKEYPQMGVKPKDLIGIPWMLAFSLRSDEWYLRQDIIWHKPNPMPESVTDRCTKSHEYIFLLSKSSKYYYNNDAIKEKAIEGIDLGLLRSKNAGGEFSDKVSWHAKSIKNRQEQGIDSKKANVSGKRNKRSVWTVNTKPFSEAHFATFPQDLIRPIIKAGVPENGIVLDPFFGAGTTGVVAKREGVYYVGIEKYQKYIDIAEKRILDTMKRLF